MSIKKILLVDDDKAANFLNRLTLKASHVSCAVDEALDGKHALNLLEQTGDCPDLIFLDINMPVMDGFQFLDEFDARGKCHGRCHIYVLTSSVRDEDRHAALGYEHVKGYFEKPLSPEHIKLALLEIKRTEPLS